jgi:uncharacterized membrane protein YoaK (UPF0700 family)
VPVALNISREPHSQTSRLVLSERWLPASLALIAGMVDLTSFGSLGGIFTAHITGNLVVLAAVVVRGGSINLAQALAVPMFMVTVAGVWVIIHKAAQRGPMPSRRVLVAQCLLLVAVLLICVSTDAARDPKGLAALVAVLLAAAAMAAQNALLHIQIPGAPSTAVMTGNLVSTVIYALDAYSADPARRAEARLHLGSVLPLLAGFLLGCLAAAAALLLDRTWVWALPAALAGLVAIAPWRKDQSVRS